jgi:hypothetical protein
LVIFFHVKISGLHDLNKLYVKIGTGYPHGKYRTVLRLDIFDIDALQYFSKDGQVLIASKEGPEKKWIIETFFIVEKGCVKGKKELVVNTCRNSIVNQIFQ